MRVACIVPTFNDRAALERLIASLSPQTLAHDLVIVDSGSTDGTAELARHSATTFVSIEQRDFNHGGTRQMAADRCADHEVLVFLTQDAVLASPDALARLVGNFGDEALGAVCARQLPHLDANPLAQHARLFNYPASSRVVDQATKVRFGLKSAFMSNSFAAYRRAALMAVGGFPSDVILAEDMYVAARLIEAGWKVGYDGHAACRHSHNYTVTEEFRRYFDLGVFHARQPWIRADLGGAGGEGRDYVVSELRFLATGHKSLWPASLGRNAVKLLGYKLGQAEAAIPVPVKRRLSMHRSFWK
ncbi:MAG TPA: glycosyltransferase family 2 protein [Sphingomonas sp.]|jgi:rhamnosyltransferase